jgi:hypothetical protein
MRHNEWTADSSCAPPCSCAQRLLYRASERDPPFSRPGRRRRGALLPGRDNPGRKEPGTGEINYRNVFKHIHGKGFRGIVGMEHGNAAQGPRRRARTNRQLVALRFASDEELPALLERATREAMKPDAIKRVIRTWEPDLDRT